MVPNTDIYPILLPRNPGHVLVQDFGGNAAEHNGQGEQEGARQDSVPVIMRLNPSRLTDPDLYHYPDDIRQVGTLAVIR